MSTPFHILVVDDEPALLRLMRAFLERVGYSIDVAATATEGLNAVAKDPARYKVIIADLTLPDMQGDQMALRMIELNPEARILLCSGYVFELESLPLRFRDRFAILQKPFVPAMLTSAIE
ncbi:MAG: response regulator, partial [Bryobacteraceae bacterium]|nr:response regulator [Bryobacteraceae bacterium]